MLDWPGINPFSSYTSCEQHSTEENKRELRHEIITVMYTSQAVTKINRET